MTDQVHDVDVIEFPVEGLAGSCQGGAQLASVVQGTLSVRGLALHHRRAGLELAQHRPHGDVTSCRGDRHTPGSSAAGGEQTQPDEAAHGLGHVVVGGAHSLGHGTGGQLLSLGQGSGQQQHPQGDVGESGQAHDGIPFPWAVLRQCSGTARTRRTGALFCHSRFRGGREEPVLCLGACRFTG